MEISVNKVFRHCLECITPILVEQGGTRSGKTFNIIQYIVTMCRTEWEGKTIDIVRKTSPSLRKSVYDDFIKVLEMHKIYDPDMLSKAEWIYRIRSNKIRFFSCDESEKVRGLRRNILFINEATELSLEDFRQLNMRTEELTILDYNPSEEFHWIYTEVLPRSDVTYHETTYLDNPFLSTRIIKEIERYKEIDENYWRVYGLGQRGVSQATIFTKFNLVDKVPENGVTYYGLDFGFNHPTSLTKVTFVENKAYAKTLFHKSNLTVTEIIEHLKELKLTSSDTIYADCARPEMIEEIYRAGFNIQPTKKGANSVIDGITLMKQFEINITKDSTDLIRELRNYKWKVDKNGRTLDEPVKINDDSVDSLRYAFNWKLQILDTYGLAESIDVSF